MQFGALSSGLSAMIGSWDTTSMAAPLSLPHFRACATAFSSMTGPRAVFSKMAPSFIVEIASALIRFTVSGKRGQ